MTKDISNHLQLYFDQIKVFPILSFEEEQEMAKQIQLGEDKLRQKLVEANLRLAVKIARTYINSGVSLLDLIQEGNIGLIYAAERFDPEKKVRFSTYASWWIKQRILRYLTNKRRMIRLPYRKEEILRKIQKIHFELAHQLNRVPNITEIAHKIGIPKEDVGAVLSLTSNVLSLESTDSDSTSILDYHEDYTYNPERELLRENSRSITMKILGSLKDQERKILMYRYQFNNSEKQTLKKISDKMGISPETVRQIAIRALEKVRANPELRNYFD